MANYLYLQIKEFDNKKGLFENKLLQILLIMKSFKTSKIYVKDNNVRVYQLSTYH